MSAVVFEDLIRPCLRNRIIDKTAIINSVTVATGTLCVFMVYIVEKLGGIIQVSNSNYFLQ
jgi:hypothetical protein